MLVLNALAGSHVHIIQIGVNMGTNAEQAAALLVLAQQVETDANVEQGELVTKIQAVVDSFNTPNPDLAAASQILTSLQTRIKAFSDLVPDVAPTTGGTAPAEGGTTTTEG